MKKKKELDFIFKISGLIEILATCHMNMYDLKINIHLILNKIILIQFLFFQFIVHGKEVRVATEY